MGVLSVLVPGPSLGSEVKAARERGEAGTHVHTQGGRTGPSRSCREP